MTLGYVKLTKLTRTWAREMDGSSWNIMAGCQRMVMCLLLWERVRLKVLGKEFR